MQTISYTQARTQLDNLIQQVIDKHEPIRLQSLANAKENIVLVSENDYQSLVETVYLLSNPYNAERLLQAIARSPKEAVAWEKVKDELGL